MHKLVLFMNFLGIETQDETNPSHALEAGIALCWTSSGNHTFTYGSLKFLKAFQSFFQLTSKVHILI